MATEGARYSVLDLSPVVQGSTAAVSFASSLDLARHAEGWGYTRFWLAEHHGIPGVASAATAVVIGHVAGGTTRIRVGAGGIMLPNHSPLVIAEQFGTLASLYPGRIDLGLGRAPGGDTHVMRALRRYADASDRFPEDVLELQGYFGPPSATRLVRAVPGEGLGVPLYLLGSSLFGARLAAELGLPFAFASHFAPDQLHVALEQYRSLFRPSATRARPYAMVGVNVIAADTDREGRRLATSLQQQFLNLIRGTPGELAPPVDDMEGRWAPHEKAWLDRATRYSAVGSPDTVRAALANILAETRTDELVVTAQIHDHGARLRSFELAAAALRDLGAIAETGTAPPP